MTQLPHIGTGVDSIQISDSHAYHRFPGVGPPRPEVPWGVFTPMAPTPTSCARSSRHSDGTAGGGDALELFGWSSGNVVQVQHDYQKNPKTNLIHSRPTFLFLSQTHGLQPALETSKYCVVIATFIRNPPGATTTPSKIVASTWLGKVGCLTTRMAVEASMGRRFPTV